MNDAAYAGKRGQSAAWCLYDWANTPFNTVIVTFVYSVFFQKSVIGDTDRGSALWAFALSASGIATAILAPLLGAVADRFGWRKLWLGGFVAAAVAAEALMWFGLPSPDKGNVLYILTMLAIAGTMTELGGVMANAMLPDLASPEHAGRLSGYSWASGYAGGLCCLIIGLFGLVGLGDMHPLIPLPVDHAQNIRAVTLLVALWVGVFSLPLLLFGPPRGPSGLSLTVALREGLADLRRLLVSTRGHGNLVRFLIASALYRDGLNTLFTVGGLYAAGTFHMGFQDILIFAIGLNVTSGAGAALFAFFDGRIGSRRVVCISLVMLIVLGIGILLVTSKGMFLALALMLGIFIGPSQSASRALVVHLAPPDMITQTYGLYALTGKSVAFMGPLCFGWATLAFASQRVGMATIILFWLAGFLLLLTVKKRTDS